MDTKDHLRKTLEYYRQQYRGKIAEMRPQLEQMSSLELMIRQLERELGEDHSIDQSEISLNLLDGFKLADSFAANRQSAGSVSVRPDEFFTMTQSDAAKAYLKKVGHAISFDELVAALRRGGAQLGGADPKRTLYVSLARNPYKEFVWPSDDHIGLAEFYAGRPKSTAMPGNRIKKAKGKAKSGKKRGRPSKVAKDASRRPSISPPDKPKTEKKPSEVIIALNAIMKDGKARRKEDIAREIEAAIGHPITKIAVFGTLQNSKQYEKQEDGQFRYRAVQ
jgi:hypothetical protein